MSTDKKEVLTVAEAMRETGLSDSTLRHAIFAGTLPAQVQIGTAKARKRYLIARSDLDAFRQHHHQRRSSRSGDAELRTAIAGLRAGLSVEAAAARIGYSGQWLHGRLTALGLTLEELQHRLPERSPPNPRERRKRLNAFHAEQKWEQARQEGKTANSLYTRGRRRAIHILFTPKAWDALHAEAERRRCSISSLVTDALYEAGLIPEP